MDGRALRSDDLNYVPQFDDLNEFFTPREVLTYMSLLKVNRVESDGRNIEHHSGICLAL